MPEGDTVYLAAQRLDAVLAGRQLTGSDLRVPAHATTDLVGWWVQRVRSRGKHLFTDLSRDETSAAPSFVLHTTLGMEGSWRTFTPGQKWNGGPAFQIRAILKTAQSSSVGYRLPHVDLISAARESEFVGHLGPDLLGTDWDADQALKNLVNDGGTAIADALLDQRNLAGVGNVFKSEICFLARVNPWTPVSQIDNLDFIVSESKRLLELNKTTFRRVTTGDPRRPAWVYSRGGQPCRRCGTPIKVAEQGPPTRQRFTWWCPACQPRLTTTDP